MNDEQLHYQLTPHVTGILLSSSALVNLLDRPGMTIEELRRSQPAETFRAHVKLFRRWFIYAIRATPPDRLTAEEKKFLEYWFPEKERAEAVGARERDGLGLNEEIR